jgi:hypothetical protein
VSGHPDDNESQTRGEGLAAIAEEYTEEIHDPKAERQLSGAEPVSRYATVTSEGSPESSYASNGNLIVADTPGELAQRLRHEAGEGWLAHGRTWDLEADWSRDGNLDYGYAAYVRSAAGGLSWSQDCLPGPQVWVCTFQHRHGLDAWVAADEAAAYASRSPMRRPPTIALPSRATSPQWARPRSPSTSRSSDRR